MYIVAGDIGGTKTHLALFESHNPRKAIREKKYPSKDHTSLEEILRDFLRGESGFTKACFGIAGPIENNRCQATNLPWIIDGNAIAKELKIPHVYLINDLEANAWGIHLLNENELFVLNKGIPGVKGNQALISAGTGLGEAGLFWDGKTHVPFACEGGHCDFAPISQEQHELWTFLKQKYDHVSYERILSGPGLYSVYQFIIETKREKENPDTKKAMQASDPSKVITARALSKECSACVKAVELFVSVYGSESGNVALKFYSLGGLFIGGGIAPKMVEEMKRDIFMKSFLAKGRLSAVLIHIPIKLILNENTALLGAYRYANEKK